MQNIFRGPKHGRQPDIDGLMLSFLQKRNDDMPISLEIILLKV
jgi:hypothetical protein